MEHLVEILKRDWPLIALIIGWSVLKSFAHFLSNQLHQKLLSRFAAQKGYKFIATDTSNAAPFFETFVPAFPYRQYRVAKVENIIQGELAGVEFFCFEQSLSVATGRTTGSANDGSYTSSAIAMNLSGKNDFEIKLILNQELSMKKMGEWIYFWPDDLKVVPVRRLEHFIRDVTDGVKTGSRKGLV